VKNQVLFAARRQSGNPPAQPRSPMIVILSAADGKTFIRRFLGDRSSAYLGLGDDRDCTERNGPDPPVIE
jgi:hypothetical protein